ncbi:MAG: two-component system response regulator [Dehalococcoidia bacterium]|nr:two-component system response regulator [Dehalococcoidia bacterium]
MLRTETPPGRSRGPLAGVVLSREGGLLHPLEAEDFTISPFPLTERERQVLSLAAEGFSNKLIAAYLEISERTVKGHLTNTMAKLQAYDRTHAVVTAVRLGWIAI